MEYGTDSYSISNLFPDTKFLEFFFKRLRYNKSESYPEFPYVSLCGREMNYVRCDDLPIVFTHFVSSDNSYALLLFFSFNINFFEITKIS